MRANKRNARIMVYEVLVGADAGSPFGSSALCLSQANIPETLSIKVCNMCITHFLSSSNLGKPQSCLQAVVDIQQWHVQF